MARRFTTALLGSISLLALSAPAFAAVETVIVTAEKRSEDITKVPMAVTVLGEARLERQVATSFADYINDVPGMTFTTAEPGHTRLTIRGINSDGVGATIGTYLDEMPYGSSSALANGAITAPNLDTYDIGQIEVLRGPQGTLYGSSTLGGLLKFVTNKPNPEAFDAKGEVGVSTQDYGGSGWMARGMVNVPLSDNIAIRVVGYHENRPGYIDDPLRGVNNVNWVHDTGGRASILFDFGDLRIRATAVMQDLNTGNDGAEDLLITGGTFVPKYGKYQQQRIAGNPGLAHYRLYNGTIDYDLGFATITSATSYGTFRDRVFQDGTGVLGVFIDGKLQHNKFTQELRLVSSDDDDDFDWIVGGYYTNENASLHQDLPPLPSPPFFVQLDSRYVEVAGYANVTYHLTDSLSLGAGGRYSHNSQFVNQFGLGLAGGTSSDNVFTWSLDAHYAIDDDSNLYARIAKGFRPGGPNALPPPPLPPGVPTFFGSDSLINYEVGVKTSMFDGEVTLDAAVYLIDWNDIQLLVVAGGFGVNANGGTAKSLGAEWNVGWNPTDRFALNFHGALNDAYLTADTDPFFVGARAGQQLPYAPHISLGLDADYTFEAIGEASPFVGGSVRYFGSRYSSYGGAASAALGFPNQFFLPSYSTLDLRAGVDWDRWEVELYGKNLNNARGITAFAETGISAGSGTAGTAAVIAPRLVGVVVRAKL